MYSPRACRPFFAWPSARESRVTGASLRLILDGFLELVRELLAFGIEELDAVVVVRVVRGADDDAEIGAEFLLRYRDCRCRQRPGEQHVDAGCDEARFERGLEHVARHARVLADQDGAALRREHARGCARKPQSEVDGHRLGADSAPNAVGAEIAPPHSDPFGRRSADAQDALRERCDCITAAVSAGRRGRRAARCLCRGGLVLHELAGLGRLVPIGRRPWIASLHDVADLLSSMVSYFINASAMMSSFSRLISRIRFASL